MNLTGLIGIAAGIGLMMAVFLGKGRLMDKHKQKLEELAAAAKYTNDPVTIANLNFHASLVVGELLIEVRNEARMQNSVMLDWEKSMAKPELADEIVQIRKLMEKFAYRSEGETSERGETTAESGGGG